MSTFCIQCAMKAMVDHQIPPTFEESPEEHLRRVHPDPAATQAERKVLEEQLVKGLHFTDPGAS